MKTHNPPLPNFLTDYASTRTRRRFTPVSRTPATPYLAHAWHAAAARNPEQHIICDVPPGIDPMGPAQRTYAEWANLIDAASGWLHALGVRPWDRVAVLKDNHFDLSILCGAIARLGAIPALLSGDYGPEIAHPLLRRLERPYLVADSSHLKSCGLDHETLATLVTSTCCIDSADGREDIVPLEELRGSAPATPQAREFSEPMVITHTSGTTGIPKLVMHSAKSLYAAALFEAERWPYLGQRTSDTFAFSEPFWHERIASGMLSWTNTASKMLMLSRPNSPDIKRLLLQHRPTWVEALPNVYLAWEELARDHDRPFSRVRVFLNSFDAIHTRTMRTFLDASDLRLPVWLQVWSQSEAGPMVFRPFLRRSVRKVGKRPPTAQTVGIPVPTFGRVRAVDPATGQRVARGQKGLIEVNAPGRCLAYVGEQERHDLKQNGNWWNTGDLGTVNRIGAVRLVDREIDQIPEGSAIECEDLLLDRLPQITEVVILPSADGPPVPVLSTRDAVPIPMAEWKQAVADLPSLADPIHIGWDEFPRTNTWKIRRGHLREQLLPGTPPLGQGRWT